MNGKLELVVLKFRLSRFCILFMILKDFIIKR